MIGSFCDLVRFAVIRIGDEGDEKDCRSSDSWREGSGED